MDPRGAVPVLKKTGVVLSFPKRGTGERAAEARAGASAERTSTYRRATTPELKKSVSPGIGLDGVPLASSTMESNV